MILCVFAKSQYLYLTFFNARVARECKIHYVCGCMIKKLAFAIMVLFSAPMQAQGYICTRQGARLEYVRKYADNGKFQWRNVMTITSFSQDGTLEYRSDFLKSNGKNYYKGPVSVSMYVDMQTGSVSMPMGKSMAAVIEARTGLSASGSNEVSVLPADMEPGSVLPNVDASAKVGVLTYRLHIYDRKVLRRETLSVPGGTFECVVLEEHKIESGPGHNRDVVNHTWYAKDVGYVRHDTYVKGVLETQEILYSIQ